MWFVPNVGQFVKDGVDPMKRILFCVCLCLSVLSTSTMAVYAVGDDTTPSGESSSIQYVQSPDVYITNEINTGEDLGEYVGTSVYALNPIEPSDASGLKAVLLEVIGPYDAIVVEHSYENTNGYTSYVREIQYDYPWLCSCGLFVVVLFCILRGGFAVLCRL